MAHFVSNLNSDATFSFSQHLKHRWICQMGHAGISGSRVRGPADSFSIVMVLMVYLIPLLLRALPVTQAWNSHSSGVQCLLMWSNPSCPISRPMLVTVWMHFHNLSFSGFGLPFGVLMSSKENPISCVGSSCAANYSCGVEQRQLTGLMTRVSKVRFLPPRLILNEEVITCLNLLEKHLS